MPETLTFAGDLYVVGGYFSWDELPSKTRRDARDQDADLEVAFGRPARDLTYQLIMIPNEDVMRILEERFGDKFDRHLRSREINKLAHEIDRRGLQYPPVGEEGWKRALAVAKLGWDLPYFQVVSTLESPALPIPTLEGNRKPVSRKHWDPTGKGHVPREWNVTVEYSAPDGDDGVDMEVDSDIQRIGAQRGGEFTGAGFSFRTMTRDLTFIFGSKSAARDFGVEVKTQLPHVTVEVEAL